MKKRKNESNRNFRYVQLFCTRDVSLYRASVFAFGLRGKCNNSKMKEKGMMWREIWGRKR